MGGCAQNWAYRLIRREYASYDLAGLQWFEPSALFQALCKVFEGILEAFFLLLLLFKIFFFCHSCKVLDFTPGAPRVFPRLRGLLGPGEVLRVDCLHKFRMFVPPLLLEVFDLAVQLLQFRLDFLCRFHSSIFLDWSFACHRARPGVGNTPFPHR